MSEYPTEHAAEMVSRDQGRQPVRVPSGIPDGVTYNGPQIFGTKVVMLFTDAITGSTFTLPPMECDFANILAAATCKRAEFNHRNQFPLGH